MGLDLQIGPRLGTATQKFRLVVVSDFSIAYYVAILGFCPEQTHAATVSNFPVS